jgi:uncharacterized OsmC-like protein
MTIAHEDTTGIAAEAGWNDMDLTKLPPREDAGFEIKHTGPDGMRATLFCSTQTVEGKHMLKVGQFGHHTVMCDEGPMIGGDDAYPPPIAYMALGMGFCLLTQLGRYAGIKKVSYRRAECDVEIDLGSTGSVLRGDVQAACYGAKTVFRVESDADPAALLEVITLAKHGCFGEAMLSNPVPMTSEIYVNGEPLEIAGITG